MNKRMKRISDWARKQPHEVLAIHFAGVLMATLIARKRSRVDRQLNQMDLQVAGDAVVDAVALGLAQDVARTWERQSGADARWKNDPSQAAKSDARELWPEANRKGWTATQFHTALVNRGHTMAYDTARKWMTKLRKTGTC